MEFKIKLMLWGMLALGLLAGLAVNVLGKIF